jgi:hypothetical protein
VILTEIPERVICALSFELQGETPQAVSVWLGAVPYGVRLADSKKTWLTAKAGDSLVVNGKPETIARVRLYSVFPFDHCDREVTCAADWLAGRESPPAPPQLASPPVPPPLASPPLRRSSR